jgi:hypothetical protein
MKYSFLLLLFLICGCNNKSVKTAEKDFDKDVEALYIIVMAKHDEVMPKIKNIRNLQLILRVDLENNSDESKSSEKKEYVFKLISKLQKGDDAMFEWMTNFKNKHLNSEFYANSKKEIILKYLKEEESKIDNVAMLMLESINEAEVYLKKAPKPQ